MGFKIWRNQNFCCSVLMFWGCFGASDTECLESVPVQWNLKSIKAFWREMCCLVLESLVSEYYEAALHDLNPVNFAENFFFFFFQKTTNWRRLVRRVDPKYLLTCAEVTCKITGSGTSWMLQKVKPSFFIESVSLDRLYIFLWTVTIVVFNWKTETCTSSFIHECELSIYQIWYSYKYI